MPRAYLAQLEPGGNGGFVELLRRAVSDPGPLDTCQPGMWNIRTPFFAVPKGTGQLTALMQAAGGRELFFRDVDTCTRANCLFIVSGIPGTVGSGTRALWCELASHLASNDDQLGIWPFDGCMTDLLARRPLVLAEVYPRATYAVALSEELPAAPIALAKTKPDSRELALQRYRSARWPEALRVRVSGFERAAANEDDFDALFTAIALTRLAATGRMAESAYADQCCEGDILGLCALDLARATISIGAAPRSTQQPPRSRARLASVPLPDPAASLRRRAIRLRGRPLTAAAGENGALSSPMLIDSGSESVSPSESTPLQPPKTRAKTRRPDTDSDPDRLEEPARNGCGRAKRAFSPELSRDQSGTLAGSAGFEPASISSRSR